MENATRLAMGMCILINLPEDRFDCDETGHNCVGCLAVGKFISEEGLDDYSSQGHVLCMVLMVLTVIVGLCGMTMSSLIITVLRRRNSGKSFDILLTVLAHVDLLCGFMVAVCTISMVTFWQNWDRGFITVLVYLCTTLIALFARSASVFMTLAIAVERYLVVAHPLTTSSWFTPLKTKFIAGSVVAFAALLILLPRGSSVYIGTNRFGGVASVQGMDYLVYTNALETFWYVDLKGVFDLIDFWVPFPLLLIFNGLVFYHIRKFSSRRNELNMKLKKDLRAGQLVLPVVVVLFLCNVEPLYTFYFLQFQGIIYREGLLGMFLSVAINSAANLPIYYLKAPGFREEARTVLREWFPFLRKSGDEEQARSVFYISEPPTGSSCGYFSKEDETQS